MGLSPFSCSQRLPIFALQIRVNDGVALRFERPLRQVLAPRRKAGRSFAATNTPLRCRPCTPRRSNRRRRRSDRRPAPARNSGLLVLAWALRWPSPQLQRPVSGGQLAWLYGRIGSAINERTLPGDRSPLHTWQPGHGGRSDHSVTPAARRSSPRSRHIRQCGGPAARALILDSSGPRRRPARRRVPHGVQSGLSPPSSGVPR